VPASSTSRTSTRPPTARSCERPPGPRSFPMGRGTACAWGCTSATCALRKKLRRGTGRSASQAHPGSVGRHPLARRPVPVGPGGRGTHAGVGASDLHVRSRSRMAATVTVP
jgi:hypothetical protein